MGHFLSGLSQLKLWRVPEEPAHTERVYYENWVRWRPEAAPGLSKGVFIAALRAEGCVVHNSRYELLSEQPIFQERGLYNQGGHFPAMYGVRKKPLYQFRHFPLSAQVRQELIHLPTFPAADLQLVEQYLQAFRKVEEHVDELVTRGLP